jgi:hypothetical protein
VLIAVGLWWYRRTPMHRARKHSGVQPPQVAGHMGFGMYTPSKPPPLPQGLHGHRGSSGGQQQDNGGATADIGDA